MPKSQYVDPNEVFKPEAIHFEDIPVNQYKKTLEEEVALYGKDELMRIYLLDHVIVTESSYYSYREKGRM